VAGDGRPTMRSLKRQLLAQPQRFNLFQALSLLERSDPERAPIGTSLGLDEAVRISGDVSLSFVPSDISAVRPSKRKGPEWTLSSSVLSLAGATGPLPIPFSELLLNLRRARDTSGLEFLDIFNQRALGFMYRGRRKHEPALDPNGLFDSAITRALDGISGLGLGGGARGPGGERAWLRHAGLQGSAPRSLATLVVVLSDRLGIPFAGKQFQGAWLPLEASDRAKLNGPGRGSQASRLDGTRSLGTRAWDQSAAIDLQAGNLSAAQYQELLPGSTGHAMVAWVATRHVQASVEIRLKPELRREQAPWVGGLGSVGAGPRLGHTSWLGSVAARTPSVDRPLTAPYPRFKLRTAFEPNTAPTGPHHGD